MRQALRDSSAPWAAAASAAAAAAAARDTEGCCRMDFPAPAAWPEHIVRWGADTAFAVGRPRCRGCAAENTTEHQWSVSRQGKKKMRTIELLVVHVGPREAPSSYP